MLLGGVLVGTKVQGYVEKTEPLAEKFTAVDYEVLNGVISSLNASLNEVKWNINFCYRNMCRGSK